MLKLKGVDGDFDPSGSSSIPPRGKLNVSLVAAVRKVRYGDTCVDDGAVEGAA